MIGIHTICQAKSWMDYDAYIAPADGDYLLINDVDDDTDDASGTVKRLAWLYVQQRNANLTSLSTIAYSANMLSFLDAADYAAMRTLLAVLPLAGGETMTGSVVFDDGVTDSPYIRLVDATDEYLNMYKADGGNLIIETEVDAERTLAFVNNGSGVLNIAVDGAIGEGGTSLVNKYQGLDSDLTSIAALTTTAYGRALLEFADEATLHANTCFASQEAAGTINLGQEYCADGATWDPTGSGLTEDHIVMPTVDNGGDDYDWVLVRTNLGVQYFAGMEISTSTYSSDQTLTVTEMSGGVIYVTENATMKLQPVFDGANFTVIAFGAVIAKIDPDDADQIYLEADSSALAPGYEIDGLGTKGDIAVCTSYPPTTPDGFVCETNGWSDGGTS